MQSVNTHAGVTGDFSAFMRTTAAQCAKQTHESISQFRYLSENASEPETYQCAHRHFS